MVVPRDRLAALACSGVLLVTAACTSGPEAVPTPTTPGTTSTASPTAQVSRPALRACLLSSEADALDDDAARAALAGLQSRAEAGVVTVDTSTAMRPEEFENRLVALVGTGCDLVMSLGAATSGATRRVAAEFPWVHFALLSVPRTVRPRPNLRPVSFAADQGAFLAGYLAAAESETGTVGVLAARRDLDTLATLDGFVAGVEWFNQRSDSPVEVIGWDGRRGRFVGAEAGRAHRVAAAQIAAGADVIFPVAPRAGSGALQAVHEAGVRAIWFGYDGCMSLPDYCHVLLTTVLTRLDDATEAIVTDAVDGVAGGRRYVGTIVNGGVDLAALSTQVDSETAGAVDALTAGIIDGTMPIG